MSTTLKFEASFDNIEIYDERELMFMACSKKQALNTHSMPEVDLVQRILKIPKELEPQTH